MVREACRWRRPSATPSEKISIPGGVECLTLNVQAVAFGSRLGRRGCRVPVAFCGDAGGSISFLWRRKPRNPRPQSRYSPIMRTFRLVERSLKPGCHEIQVEGEVDLAVADRLKEAIEKAADAHDQILVGLQRCEFVDSTAIAVLVHAHGEMADQGKRVVIYGASGQVGRVLSLTGLTQNGLVFENVGDALALASE